MPQVTVPRGQISYERRPASDSASKDAPPLLLIMGMSGTFRHWGEPFLEQLGRERELILFDHRGVGDSSQLEGPITIAEMADDADALLETLAVPAADVVGISMGGMVAQELALRHPERVRSLVLGCTYAGGDGALTTSPEVVQRLADGMMSSDRERAIRIGWEVNVSAAVAADQRRFEQFREIALANAVAVPVIMAQTQACVAHDTVERLAELKVPTLVIHGTDDQMLPVGNANVLADRIPGARLEIFDGTGHMFFWEHPQRSAQLVLEHAPAPAPAA